MTKLNGFLDHLRENLEVLDEQIATARKMSKPKGKADKSVVASVGEDPTGSCGAQEHDARPYQAASSRQI